MRSFLQIWIAGLLAVAVMVCGQAQDIERVEKIYAKNLESIRSKFQPQFESLQQQYSKSLETLKSSVQGEGDFEKTKAAVKEIERFGKTKTLPTVEDETEIAEIKALQSTYVSQYSLLETSMIRQLGGLTEKYAQALDRQLKELTKVGKLDEAAAVQEEIKKAQDAVKGYAETVTGAKDPVTTNSTVAVASEGAVVQVTPLWATGTTKDLYLVIDLSGGKNAKEYPASHLADVPDGGWSDEYKTTKLVMRKISKGTFTMGGRATDYPGASDSGLHQVTLTQNFYIGVFEVTQRQWELVTGTRFSFFENNYYATHPVEKVSYDDIRGSSIRSGWPDNNNVNATVFMGKLRAKTGLSTLDLPTESQWEYACRAGTAPALNSGKNLTGISSCPNMAEVGRYSYNGGSDSSQGSTTAKVGSYLPNKWGLYDMHGNVWEWCLDWYGSYPGTVTDPRGAASGSGRVLRGGSWRYYAQYCRSANRYNSFPSIRGDNFGFRIVSTLP